jgi:hypothetical protein
MLFRNSCAMTLVTLPPTMGRPRASLTRLSGQSVTCVIPRRSPGRKILSPNWFSSEQTPAFKSLRKPIGRYWLLAGSETTMLCNPRTKQLPWTKNPKRCKTTVFEGSSAVPRIHVGPSCVSQAAKHFSSLRSKRLYMAWLHLGTFHCSTLVMSSRTIHTGCAVPNASEAQRPAIELEPRILFRPNTNFRQTPSAARRPTPYRVWQPLRSNLVRQKALPSSATESGCCWCQR